MKKSRFFWGIAVLAAGILLLLGALGIGEQYGLMRIIATLLLLGFAFESLFRLHFVLFFIPIAVSGYLWRLPLGFPDINLTLLLIAAVLLGISCHILFRRGSLHRAARHAGGGWRTSEETLSAGDTAGIEVNFGEQIKHIHASQLRQLRIDSNFAKAVAIFEQVQLPPEGLRILIDGNFSEIVLRVPRAWTVDSQLRVFAAAVSGLPAGSGSGAAPVVLDGSIRFGEVRIEYL